MANPVEFKWGIAFRAFALVGILALVYWKFMYTPNVAYSSIDCYDDSGQKVDMNTGNPAMVSFYQTWCADCRRETPVLDSFSKLHGIDLYLISDESIEKTEKFRSLFPQVTRFYHSKKSLSEIGIKKFPTVYFFTKEGTLVFKKLEVVEKSDLDNYLEALH
jgi:thiol-disulfide isomerase/thioredoxin